jgi:hypothetical protein
MSFNIAIDPVKAAAIAAEKAEANRHAAYIAEADPLFFKWQAGESTEVEWVSKREEIKARYPDPVQPEPNAG